MKKTVSLAALCCLTFSTAAVAADKPYAEGNYPGVVSNARAFPALTAIYRFTSVFDNGTADNTGQGTAVTCTNWGASATVQINVRESSGFVLGAKRFTLGSNGTLTAVTKRSLHYFDDILLLTSPATINQGSILVYATSASIQCVAVTLDASTSNPTFINNLPAQRLSPQAGVTE